MGDFVQYVGGVAILSNSEFDIINQPRAALPGGAQHYQLLILSGGWRQRHCRAHGDVIDNPARLREGLRGLRFNSRKVMLTALHRL